MVDLPAGFRVVAPGGKSAAPAVPQGFRVVEQPKAEEGQWERNVLLPREVNTATGESRLAVPGIIQGAADAAVDAFNLPGDVLTGKVDPMSDEGIARSAGAGALMVMPGAPGVGQAAARLAPEMVTVAKTVLPDVAKGAAPMTVKGAQAAAKANYKAVEKSGAVVGQDALNLLNHDFKQFAVDEGLVLPSGKMVADFPKVRTALDAVEEFSAAPLNMKSAMTLQRQLRRAAKSTDPEEARLGAVMLDKFEDYMTALPDNAFVGGNGPQAVKAWGQAKSDWATFRKGQTLDDAITTAYRKAAKFGGSGFENALRNEFDKLAGNERKMRFFSREERALIAAVAQGTPIANALRQAGKFAPTGVVGTTLSGLAGYGMWGLPGAAATLGIGGLARNAATKQTKKAADEALQFVLGNQKAAPRSRLPQGAPQGGLMGINAAGRAYGGAAFEQGGGDVTRSDLRRLIGTTISM